MLDVLFALVIISPVDIPATWFPPIVSPGTLASLRRAAKALDLAGDVETWRRDNFRHEIVWSRFMWQQLRGTPSSWDALRFPPAEVATVFAAEVIAYKEYLEAMRWIDLRHWRKYDKAIQAADHRINIWTTLQVVNSPLVWVHHKRQNLRRLRELLGDEDYFSGLVQPPIPPWLSP